MLLGWERDTAIGKECGWTCREMRREFVYKGTPQLKGKDIISRLKLEGSPDNTVSALYVPTQTHTVDSSIEIELVIL